MPAGSDSIPKYTQNASKIAALLNGHYSLNFSTLQSSKVCIALCKLLYTKRRIQLLLNFFSKVKTARDVWEEAVVPDDLNSCPIMCVIEGMLDAARLQLILIVSPARSPSGCNQALQICFSDYSLGV